MKILVFTDNDLDGAGSALFIKWLFRDKLQEFDVIDTTEGTFTNDFKQHEPSFNNYDRVFILDLDLSYEQATFVNHEKVVIVDHHVPHQSHSNIYNKAKGIIQQADSCIGLLYEKFSTSVELTAAQKELITYINDYDSYNLKHKDSLKLNAIHKTYNNPKSLKFIQAFEEGFRPYTIQEKNSIKGKIIKINTSNSNYEIISMGHRNPQGLLFDKEINSILVTEHGPLGGDEINLIEVDKISNDEPSNFGWAIESAGEHYCTKHYKKSEEPCASKYKKFPLYKSHTKYDFIEPLISFVPSIAISEIVKIEKNNYVLGSMGANKDQHKSLYFFQLNDEKKMINLQQVKVFQRVRDLVYKNEVLYLLFEEPSSIGVISLK